jgi:trehalose 2-sulfotransferase
MKSPLIFAGEAADPKRFQRLLREEPASIRYVMHFTPRSGSSWLTDICKLSGRLSEPGEHYNPNFVPNISKALHARNISELVQGIVRRRNSAGVYGCQITFYQLRVTFEQEAAFDQLLGGSRMIFLIREDIVLQAVSLCKMVTTSVSHRPMTNDAALQQAEETFAYDNLDLIHWLHHIHRAEIGSEALFKRFGYNPMRMSYEQNMAMTPLEVINRIAAHINVPLFESFDQASRHTKIGTDKNQAFADRFREENRSLVEEIEDERKGRLKELRGASA